MLVFRSHIWDAAPLWNDELGYWRESVSFAAHGVNMGYITFDELIPRIGSFGLHGLGCTIVYAVFALIFGPVDWLIPISNLLVLSLAILCLFLLLPSLKDRLWCTLLITLFPPLNLYILSSMSEILNYAICIAYAVLLHRLALIPKKKGHIILFLFVFFSSFIRVYYVLFLFPALWVWYHSFTRRSFCVATLCFVYAVTLYVLVGLFVAPYPDGFLTHLFDGNSFEKVLSAFVSHAFHNFLLFIYDSSAAHIEIIQRWAYLSTMLYLLYRLIRNKCRGYVIALSMLLLFWGCVICAYDVFAMRDYRVLSPILLSSYIYIERERRWFPFILIAIECVISAYNLSRPGFYQSNQNRFVSVAGSPEFEVIIPFDTTATDPFENTVIVPTTDDRYLIKNLSLGLGVSVVSNPELAKSRYLISYTPKEILGYTLIAHTKSNYYVYCKQN